MVKLGWGKGDDWGKWIWVVCLVNVADHLEDAGVLGVDVGVLGLLVTLGDAQVEGEVL